jgi:hypothetical protein
LISFLKRMLSRFRAADDRVVIDQQSYYDALEFNQNRIDALDRAVAREQERIALVVGAWARDTVRHRARVIIPRIVGRAIAAWLPGLTATEIMYVSNAGAFGIRHHLFGTDRIAGVRHVQPLPEAVLVWPRPKLVADPQSDRGAGGGPRLKSKKFG